MIVHSPKSMNEYLHQSSEVQSVPSHGYTRVQSYHGKMGRAIQCLAIITSTAVNSVDSSLHFCSILSFFNNSTSVTAKFFFFFLIREREHRQGRGAEGGERENPCSAWSLMKGLIPWPWDHELRWNHESDARWMSHTDAPQNLFPFWETPLPRRLCQLLYCLAV